ncbi:zinc ribbon domain-containing protein [Candidatus Nitrososphaera evergladensis]|uniref:zinc ribbon domain-containing protein n=1 Tax=Candidatus Nitrososphaera evergladensis TaxID=1459637 RepID=UPI0011E5BFBB|nr:zinc ribbon domain-containing protein [Candidatus Nitrososphaera evergladensis]
MSLLEAAQLITRGSITFQSTTKDAVFDAFLLSCKQAGADIKSADRTTYRIDGKSGTMWLQNRFSFRFHARLVGDDNGGGSQGVRLEVYDFAPSPPDKRFIEKLLKKVVDKIPGGKLEYNLDCVEQPGDAPVVPAKNTAAPIAIVSKGQLMADARMIPTFEYSLQGATGDDGSVHGADKLIIMPPECGNVLSLYKGASLVLGIAISSIEKMMPVMAEKKGLLGKKGDLSLDILYNDGSGGVHSVRVNVDDEKGGEIVDKVNRFEKIQKEQDIYYDFEYLENGQWLPDRLYPATLFLAKCEKLVWLKQDTAGVFSKHYKWIKALTNIRVFYYNFESRAVDAMALSMVQDVTVINKRKESVSRSSGTIDQRERGSYTTGHFQSARDTTTVTVGDVAFMYNGAPRITFVDVEDPDGLATLAREAIANSKFTFRLKPQQWQPAGKSPSAQQNAEACPKCNAQNLPGSNFCAKCGFTLH